MLNELAGAKADTDANEDADDWVTTQALLDYIQRANFFCKT